MRGPRADGRWYWRAGRYEAGGDLTVWCGWATTEEADAAVVARLAGLVQPTADDVQTVRELLVYWLGAIETREDLARNTIVSLVECPAWTIFLPRVPPRLVGGW